jgi:hypothetical protein
MNVIISNNNKELLNGLSIEVIKRLDGEYSVDEIINTFKNFFFNKMIIDITAIKDYQNLNNIQKLSSSFDANKLIILLDSNSSVATPDYISRLISIGIYNFSTNLEGITYLYNNPNSYKDVAQYHRIDSMIVEDDSTDTVSDSTDSNSVEEEKPKFVDIVKEPEKSTTESSSVNTKIIGVKSVTPGAGSTTLVYMMKKQLEKKYKVLAVEVEKRDFIYFNDNTLISSSNGVIGDVLTKNDNMDVLLVDLNGSQSAENFCTDVIYLLEPSIIKVNRLLSIKPKILNELKGKKVILCPSLLSDKDVKEFEYESGLSIFYNMKPVDDHASSEYVDELLSKLGI